MSTPSASREFGKSNTATDVLQGIDITGKTFLITGANSGIGFQTAKALAQKDAHVIMACRNMTTASEAKDKIVQEKPDANVSIIQLDCSDLRSVEQCAKEYQETKWPLNCLILNAGLFSPPDKFTKDGFESTFQVNHLSQFYLSQLLLPQLKASAPSRVVAVASTAHKSSFMGPNDVKREILSPIDERKIKAATKTYGMSKMCNIWFANEFNLRYSSDGVMANSLHPGVIQTNLARSSGVFRFFMKLITPVTVSEPQGAATTTYVATAPELNGVGGKYFSECKETTPNAAARSKEAGKTLWELSEQMIREWKEKAGAKT